MGSSIPYGGAFSNNVPGRVGSAPATDPSMVRFTIANVL
jgi:hypothetical protein